VGKDFLVVEKNLRISAFIPDFSSGVSING